MIKYCKEQVLTKIKKQNKKLISLYDKQEINKHILRNKCKNKGTLLSFSKDKIKTKIEVHGKNNTTSIDYMV